MIDNHTVATCIVVRYVCILCQRSWLPNSPAVNLLRHLWNLFNSHLCRKTLCIFSFPQTLVYLWHITISRIADTCVNQPGPYIASVWTAHGGFSVFLISSNDYNHVTCQCWLNKKKHLQNLVNICWDLCASD